jgi:DNA polymerase-1
MSKLLIIDGNAIMHRAFHALPPLTAPDGTVINAVYGFLSMLFTVVQDQKPDYVIVSFDISKPTLRQSMYAGYHQHRPEMASDLSPQFPLIHQALEKMKVAIYEVSGFEADDVIGTIATQVVQKTQNTQKTRKSEESENLIVRNTDIPNHRLTEFSEFSENIEVIILTGDRDLLQLVNPQVKILMPVVGVKVTALFDEKAVEEKYGVHPRQFVDYKALIGDASDGYPGVTGIGPKTAANLLKEHGTFEALYEKIGSLPEKYATKLATDAEQAALAKKLATIITDVPITCDLRKTRWLDFDTNGARKVFAEFGFNSLEKRFAGQLKEIEEKRNGEQLGLL